MKSILAAVLIVTGFCIAADAATAAEECQKRSCATTTVAATPTGWNLKLSVRQGPGNEADWFNLRVLGHPQLELNTPSGEMNLGIPTGWDGTFALQGCESSFSTGSFCDTWSNFRVELPIAGDDRNFCVRYAGHATSEATSAQQMSCNFSTPPGRWSTDNAFHLNWCLDQIRNAGGNPGMLVAARQLADSEDRARIDSITACQSAIAAAKPCPEGQIRLQGNCQVPGVVEGTSTGTGGGFIQMFPTCPAGKKLDVPTKTCVDEAPPVQATPTPAPPLPSGGMTASTCGLSGPATVTIGNPSLSTLNVRKAPEGEIVTTIPRGAPVNVVGACGSTLSAGIVAPKVVPGWCAISAPVTGCVKEEFLVAGTGMTPGAPGTAGLVAPQPAATATNFTGAWAAEAQGYSYTFNLAQNGSSVTGNYAGTDGSSGQLSGTVSGNALRFTWQQTDGVTGAGKFTMNGDGGSFNGSYTLGTNPDVAEGSWNGRRQ